MAQGSPPNDDIDDPHKMIERIKKGVPKLQGTWSKEFKDFVSKCLVADPNKRASSSQLLIHPFIKGM